jgi:hypothetical protein
MVTVDNVSFPPVAKRVDGGGYVRTDTCEPVSRSVVPSGMCQEAWDALWDGVRVVEMEAIRERLAEEERRLSLSDNDGVDY